MKQKLFLALALLMTVCSFCKADNVLIAEIDWTQESAYYSGVWYSSNYATLEVSSNGLEITSNPPENANYWDPQVPMIAHIPYLEAGASYQVTFTVDAPAAGELRLDLCSWDGSSAAMVEVVNVQSGLHEYTIDFNDYPTSCTDAMIFYQCGKIPGNHIIKNVQVWGPDDNNREAYAVYNESNKLLTFYYDSDQEGKTGDVFPLNTGQDLPGWHDKEIVTVVFNQTFSKARPTTTRAWFEEQESLEGISNLEFLNTSEVTDMGWMFYHCEKLRYIKTKTFDTSKVTNMSSMFCNCSSLTTLDLSSFNTSKVTDMTNMFLGCNSLQTIYVGAGWNTSKVTDSDNMFLSCDNIKGGTGTTYNEGNVNADYARIDGGESIPGYLTERPSGYAVYYDNTLTFYNDGKMDEKPGDESNKFLLDVDSEEKPGWQKYNTQINKVVFDESFATARPLCTYSWFEQLSSSTEVFGWENLNTSKVTCMDQMFNSCGITSLDLSYFNTQNVTSMNMMFSECQNLITLDLSSFDTSNVTNMFMMFDNCRNLEELNLSNFDTQNVTVMMNMFKNCSKLKTIYVGEKWDTQNVQASFSMFYGCEALKGENGTEYNSNYTDKTYARIDGGETAPGYLTAAVSYGITVSGKPVTFANKYDILGDETVYYDYDLNTLTLSNANVSSISIASSAPDNLRILVWGECKVKHTATSGDAFTTNIASTTIEGEGNGKLTITSKNGAGIRINRSGNATLTIKDIDLIAAGKTAGILGRARSTTTFYSSLVFNNTNCTISRTGADEGSVGIIRRMRFDNCTMTSGVFENNMVLDNPMMVERNSVGITTGVERLNDNGEMINDKVGWYTIDGRKMSGKPTQKGIYIHNGHKRVIK